MNKPRLKQSKTKTIFKGVKGKSQKSSKPSQKSSKEKANSSSQQFPRNFRFIPEVAVAGPFFTFNLYYASRFILFTLIVAILLVFLDIIITLSTKQYSNTLFVSLQQQKQYWTEVSEKYPGYRDAYMQLAIISYRLGEAGNTKLFAQKALTIDPNYTAAQTLLSEVEK